MRSLDGIYKLECALALYGLPILTQKPVFTLPTWITLLRIVLMPVLVLVFLMPWGWTNFAATAVFGLASITDWLDGYLARRLELSSRFGAFLDPVADKLIVATALILIVYANQSVLITVASAVIIGREITVSALREWMAEVGQRAKIGVGWVGKTKTTAQIIAILFLLYSNPIPVLGISATLIGEVALIVAAILTLWSMYHYLAIAWPVMRQEPDEE